MKIWIAIAVVALCSGSAQAETWRRVVNNPGGNTEAVDVDVDSIREDSDGLVYFRQSDDWDDEIKAFDCANRSQYSVDYWKRLNQDWHPHPMAITGFGADIFAFVCARAS